MRFAVQRYDEKRNAWFSQKSNLLCREAINTDLTQIVRREKQKCLRGKAKSHRIFVPLNPNVRTDKLKFDYMTELEKCLNGENFDGGDAELATMTLRTKRLLAELNRLDYGDVEGRDNILRQIFGSAGRNLCVDIDFHCEYGKNIHVGDDVIINMNCTFVDNNRIDIGSHVLIASDVKIYTATHSTQYVDYETDTDATPFQRRYGRTLYAKPVRIKDGAWIGGGTVILPGVTIGARSVVGAGSVVTRDIPADCVAVGNPCRVIKRVNKPTDHSRLSL